MGQAREVDNSELWSLGTRYFNTQHVPAKSAVPHSYTHRLLRTFDQKWQISKVLKGPSKLSQFLPLILGTFTVRQNSDDNSSLRSTPENYLCCEACAEVVFAREGNLRNCFEDGRFTRGLVSTNHDLGERNEFIYAMRTELVDFVEEAELLE